MAKHKYVVGFYYATDSRAVVHVEAVDQVHALVLALSEVGGWPSEYPFRIVIEQPRE